MFYTNGCLKTCGTYDVVILEKDQVVDAIVRAQGRRYDGVSSSPPDRKPGRRMWRLRLRRAPEAVSRRPSAQIARTHS